MANYERIKNDLINRLKRIEGQARGVVKMVEEDKSCQEILTQVASLRAAINKIGILILENHLKTCINEATKEDRDVDELEELTGVFLRFLR
ncbi:MAG: metal-sensitive transcriptional regulator [Candidatus Aminicenantia bacterium]